MRRRRHLALFAEWLRTTTALMDSAVVWTFSVDFSTSSPDFDTTILQPDTGETVQVAFRSVGTLQASSTATSTTPTEPTGAASGDLLIVFASAAVFSGDGNGFTVTNGTGWLPLHSSLFNFAIDAEHLTAGADEQFAAYYMIRGGSAPTYPTFSTNGTTSGGGGIYSYAVAYSGASAAAPIAGCTVDFGQSIGTFPGPDFYTTNTKARTVGGSSTGSDTNSGVGAECQGATMLSHVLGLLANNASTVDTGWTADFDDGTATGIDFHRVGDHKAKTVDAYEVEAGADRNPTGTWDACIFSVTVRPAKEESYAVSNPTQYPGKGVFYAGPAYNGGSTVGKAQISKEFDAPAVDGDVVYSSMTFTVARSNTGGDPIDGVKLWDAENKLLTGNPGVRVDLNDTAGTCYMRLERSKLDGLGGPYGTFGTSQAIAEDTAYAFEIELTIGDDTTGRTRIWIDSSLIMDEVGNNRPDAGDWGSDPNADQLDVVQIGATANSGDEPALVIIDDFVLTVTHNS